jgi:alpha-1,2-mannosyltransferase
MWMATAPTRWLTGKRLWAHAIVLAVCLWSVYVWNLATPGLRDRGGNIKGTDFVHFYTLGSLAVTHRGADLYDMNAQAALISQRIPQAAGIRYLPLYPPQVSLLFAPLAYFPYGRALAVWWIFSAMVYAGGCFLIWRGCAHLRNRGTLVALLAAGFPAFFHLIAWGQSSALALICFTFMFMLLRSGREFTAGLVLGCLIFKPQLGLAAAVLFVVTGAWKIVLGATISSGLQIATGVLYYGVQPFDQWIGALGNIGSVLPGLEPRVYQTHSLRSFWAMLIPWPSAWLALYGLSAVVLLGLTIVLWKNAALPLSLRYPVLLLATVLVAPHLSVYDLVILAPAFLLIADWIVGQTDSNEIRWLGLLLYLIYVLPLFGPLARWTHLQLSVIAMAATVVAIYRWSPRIASAITIAEVAHTT